MGHALQHAKEALHARSDLSDRLRAAIGYAGFRRIGIGVHISGGKPRSSKSTTALHYLWRAVDQHGTVLDVLVQSRRNALAAKKFFRRLLKGLEYVPRVIVTDKLTSYSVAHREILASVEHRRSKYSNNRAENSHQPTRQRERAMKHFTSVGHAQRFLSAFSSISRISGPAGID